MAPRGAEERQYFIAIAGDPRPETSTPVRAGRSPARTPTKSPNNARGGYSTPTKQRSQPSFQSPHQGVTPVKQRSLQSPHRGTTPVKQRPQPSFQSPRRGATPVKPKRVYPRVMCMFCVNAFAEKRLQEVEIIDGRAVNLRRHLAKCAFAESYRKGSATTWDGPAWERGLIKKMRKLAVELMADAKLPAAFFERESFLRLIETISPDAARHMPDRKYMGGIGLDEAARESDELSKQKLEAKQREFKVPVALLSDGWTNIAKTQVLGCQLSLHGCSHTMELLDPGTRHDGIAIAQQLEDIIKRVAKEFKKRAERSIRSVDALKRGTMDEESSDGESDEDEDIDSQIGPTGFKVGACITDNAGQCARARRILSVRHPEIIFLHCFAHDVNNLVKDVLKSEFSSIAKKASTAVNYLNAASATWLRHAKDIMQQRYGEERSFDRLCETRWNSIHDCFTSLLRVRGALEVLAYTYKSSLPEELAVFSNPTFWQDLEEAERVVAPLAEASYRLQRNENTLADVVLSLRDIYYAFASNIKYGRSLVRAVEARWSKCEQPLFVVAFFLHPALRDETAPLLEANPKLERILSDAVIYYYRRFYGEDTGTIRDDLSEWLSRQHLGVRLSDFKNPAPSYWKHVRGEYPKLSQLCVRIFSVPVHTANVERLFSELGAIHSALRNRLQAEKARKLHSVAKRVREEVGSALPVSKKRMKIRAPAELKVKLHAPVAVVQHHSPEDDESFDPGDGSLTCVIDSFDFIQQTLEAIFDDQDLTDEFSRDKVGGEIYNPLEEIPKPRRDPWPENNDSKFRQEHKITGFRSWSITLADLFPLHLRPSETRVVEK